jgi:hypothetical protein
LQTCWWWSQVRKIVQRGEWSVLLHVTYVVLTNCIHSKITIVRSM